MYATAIHSVNQNGINLHPFIPSLVSGVVERELMYTRKDVVLEQIPLLYKKRYFAGCLDGTTGKTVMVKRIGGLGDCIWTLPVIKELNRRYDCKIVVLTFKKDLPLFDNISYVIKKVALEDVNVSDMQGIDYFLDYYCSVEAYAPAEYKDPYDISYEWAFNQACDIDVTGNIILSEKDKFIYDKPYMVVCLDSSNPKRTYPHVKGLVEAVKKAFNGDIIMLGYKKSDYSGERIVNMTGLMDLRKYFGIIAGAEKCICTDSGNLHIAGQFNIPTVCLFSTVRSTERIGHYPSVKGIDSEELCAPCLKLAEPCPMEGECMSGISVKKIMSVFEGV